MLSLLLSLLFCSGIVVVVIVVVVVVVVVIIVVVVVVVVVVVKNTWLATFCSVVNMTMQKKKGKNRLARPPSCTSVISVGLSFVFLDNTKDKFRITD